MGRRSEQHRSFATDWWGQQEQEYGRRERQRIEEQRGYLEWGLGSDAQLSGAYGDAGAGTTYTAYFDPGSLDPIAGHGFGGWNYQNFGGGDINAYAQNIQAEASAMLSGGMDVGEVEAWIESKNPYAGIFERQFWNQAFRMEQDPEQAARRALGSTQGMIVGQMVRKGQDLLDTQSAASKELRSLLQDESLAALEEGRINAGRAIASEQRTFQRQAEMAAARRGSSANPAREAAIAARVAERFGSQKAQAETQFAERSAQIRQQANTFYATYRDQFATNAIGLAQQWVNNQSGVRDEFTQSLARFNAQQVDLLNRAAERHNEWAIESENRAQASKARTDQWIMYGVTAALVIAGGLAGAGLAAGAAGGMTAAEGAIAGAQAMSAVGGATASRRKG